MKSRLLLLSLLVATTLQSQTVLNGSFENTIAPPGCNYNISNATYTSYMMNSTAFGIYEAIDVVVNGCYVNNIPNGVFGVSLANDPTNNLYGEAISLALSAPLIIGSTYQIDFQATAVQYSTVTQGDLWIGVSTSPSSFGTIVDTANTVENVWNTYSFTFTATSAATNITVMPVPGVSSWNCVDAFSIMETCAATSGTDVITACESYTWIDGVTYTSSNNTATDTLINAAGCDSIVTLDLTINPMPSNNVIQNGATLTADQFGPMYQWVNCDSAFAVIPGATNQSFTPMNTGNYALIVNLNGCVDTSACYLVDYTGMEEVTTNKKSLLKVVDLMGRKTTPQKNKVLIYVYSDGTTERVFEFESN